MNETPSNRNPDPQKAPAAPAADADDQSIDDLPLFKRKSVIIPIFLLILALAGGGWFWYVQRFSSVYTDDAYVDADRVDVSAKMAGRIVRLTLEEGDTVRQGDTLVRLDDADLQAQRVRDEAQVSLAMHSAEVSSVNLAKAKDDYDRSDRQYHTGIVPKEQYDHALNALQLAQAQRDMAQSQIGAARADLGVVESQLNNTVVVAPFTGVVAKKWVLQGDVIAAGQPIVSLYNMEKLWITANYEETKLRAIRPGDVASIAADAWPGAVIHGRVVTIGRSTTSQFSLIPPNNASGNFTKVTQRVPIKISIESITQAPATLVPGLSVSVKILSR